ncbi:MAG: MMPL family transporter [Bacilli bacterium]
MKKFTDFIVNKKYIILVVCIILSAICLFLNTKVNINYDIAKYLPSTSETRIGMDIMEKEFEEVKSSSLNIMFDGLNSEEKEEILSKLSNIDNVSSVNYDESENYNIDNYTLYTINIDDTSNSKKAAELYKNITKEFKNYDISLSGPINDANKPVLHLWIVLLAIAFAMVILIIMCESYIEPFLFLFVIGLAVFLNNGTNIIFSSVSHITNAISAILQMALSMDYSIMLMNRYSQERENESDKNKAMKRALYNSFKSISSSSITTIVGLLALIFMSFTIGRDLGFVLAKGVLFSLLCIFLCLPGLILLFDKVILKTKKKTSNIKLDYLGKLSYKLRYPGLILFFILLIGSFFLKNGLGILYTDVETDDIAKHFKENNQMAIVYNNKYESDISNFCNSLNDKKVTQLLCYSNTINEPLKYDQLNAKIESLGASTNIDDYIIKVLYFNKYNEIENKMSLSEMLTFIEKDVLTNEELSKDINKDIKDNLYELKYFTNINEINKKRSSKEIASILKIDEETVNTLFILYNSKNANIKISARSFIMFLNNNVLNNEKYNTMLDNNTKNSIKSLLPFTDSKIFNKKMTKEELSKVLGVDSSSIESLMLLYYTTNDTEESLSISNFIKGIEYIKENTDYLNNVDTSNLNNLIPIISNTNNINNTKMNQVYLNEYFQNINPSLVNMVYNNAHLPNTYTMSPQEFVDFTLTNFANYLSNDQIDSLNFLKFIIDDSINPSSYKASEMATIFNFNINQVYSIYALILNSNNYEFKLTPYELVNIIKENQDNPLISSKLDNDFKVKIELVIKIMNSINNDISYSSKELANLLNITQDKINLLYSLYDIEINKKQITPSLNNFISFMLNTIEQNKENNSSLSNDAINKLKTIEIIMDSSLKNHKYDSSETYKLLSSLTNDLDKNLIELVYTYYGSLNNYNDDWTFTVEDFINYLNDMVLNDNKFSSFIDNNRKHDIKESKKMITQAKDLLKSEEYSRVVLNTEYNLESEETFDFIALIQDKLNSKDKEIYVIGDSAMAYDMSKTFNKELNFITILTMVAIFVVVAITFKSVIISLILVLIIQCAVYITMSILSLTGGNVYFIALLIVQSILMGATIDYAIVYTSYYKEYRNKHDIMESLKLSYNKSIHTILTSSSILIIVTLVVGKFASAIAAKICLTLSEGTICSVILILFILPSCLAASDRIICRDKYSKKKIKVKQ